MANYYTEAAQEAETLRENASMKGEMETLLMRRLQRNMPKIVTVKSFVNVKPLVLTSTGVVCTGTVQDDKTQVQRDSSHITTQIATHAQKGFGKSLSTMKNALAAGGKSTNTTNNNTPSTIQHARKNSVSIPLNETQDRNDDDELDQLNGESSRIKQYVLKIVYKDLAVSEAAVAKVLNEAKMLAEMPLSQHPFVPRLVTKFQTNDSLIMVMEKVNTNANPCDLWSLIYELGNKLFFPPPSLDLLFLSLLSSYPTLCTISTMWTFVGSQIRFRRLQRQQRRQRRPNRVQILITSLSKKRKN